MPAATALGPSRESDKLSLGGKIVAGYNIAQRFFTELSWNKVQSTMDVDPSNVSLVFGFRF